METLKDFYQDISNLVDLLIENPYTALLIVGLIILATTIMVMITRHTYSRIVTMIDEGEQRAIERRVEEWGEMIVNNVQQECMEKKLSLTIFSFILPILGLLMIGFSIYKLDMIPNLVITVIHLFVLSIIFYIVKLIRGKKRNTKKDSIPASTQDD